MYCKPKKSFGVIRRFLKIFDFPKSLSKSGPTVEDFNSSWFWLLRGSPFTPYGGHWLRLEPFTQIHSRTLCMYSSLLNKISIKSSNKLFVNLKFCYTAVFRIQFQEIQVILNVFDEPLHLFKGNSFKFMCSSLLIV